MPAASSTRRCEAVIPLDDDVEEVRPLALEEGAAEAADGKLRRTGAADGADAPAALPSGASAIEELGVRVVEERTSDERFSMSGRSCFWAGAALQVAGTCDGSKGRVEVSRAILQNVSHLTEYLPLARIWRDKRIHMAGTPVLRARTPFPDRIGTS